MAYILVVSSNPHLKEDLARCLPGEHRLEHSGDTEHAIQAVEESVPELVVVDRSFSILRAILLVRRIRHRTGRSPVILVAVRGGSAAERMLAMEIGADDCIEKPFAERIVRSKLRFWLEQRLQDTAPDSALTNSGERRHVGDKV